MVLPRLDPLVAPRHPQTASLETDLDQATSSSVFITSKIALKSLNPSGAELTTRKFRKAPRWLLEAAVVFLDRRSTINVKPRAEMALLHLKR